MVTISGDTPTSGEELPPEAKRLKLVSAVTAPLSKATPKSSSGSELSGTEVSAVQQLISGGCPRLQRGIHLARQAGSEMHSHCIVALSDESRKGSVFINFLNTEMDHIILSWDRF